MGKAKLHSKELEPDTEKLDQPSPLDIGLGVDPFVRPDPDIHVAETPVTLDYAGMLAFNEEPVTIEIPASSDPFAPLYVEAWVNGKGIERFLEGIGWTEVKFVPVDTPVTIKRKYLENLLRSKKMNVMTIPDKADGSEPRNLVNRTYSRTHAIRIIEDRNPRGTEWAKAMQRSL